MVQLFPMLYRSFLKIRTVASPSINIMYYSHYTEMVCTVTSCTPRFLRVEMPYKSFINVITSIDIYSVSICLHMYCLLFVFLAQLVKLTQTLMSLSILLCSYKVKIFLSFNGFYISINH